MDDDNQSDSLWAHLKGFFRGKEEQDPLEKAIEEARDEGDLAAEDAEMLLNILQLREHTVWDLMIPRPDMICIAIDETITDAGRIIEEHGHSRIPVFKENKDNIVGVVHARDLLPALLDGSALASVSSIMRPSLFVPETRNGRDMLREFLARRTHMAIVLDEYGGTSGLVTLEDVIEAVVGDIEDEHEVEAAPELQVLEDGRVLVSGRFMLEDLNEALGLDLSSEQMETIGGYVSELAGRVPRKGQSFTVAGRRMIVTDADKKLVRWIMIEPLAPDTPVAP